MEDSIQLEIQFPYLSVRDITVNEYQIIEKENKEPKLFSEEQLDELYKDDHLDQYR